MPFFPGTHSKPLFFLPIESPIIVSSLKVSEKSQKQLLKFSFEVPPKDDGVFDQRIRISSSPLEITYDKRTFNAVLSMFKTPDEINLDYLQQQAFEKLKEYQESSTLTLNYIIENHSVIDVDVVLRPSRIIIPSSGEQKSNCACSVLNLGKNFNI